MEISKNGGFDIGCDSDDGRSNSLGDRLRLTWTRSGLTQDDFASQLGISTVSLSNYFANKRLPKSDVISRTCTQFQVSPAWLLFGQHESSTTPDMPSQARDRGNDEARQECCELRRECSELRTENRELRQAHGDLMKEHTELVREHKELINENARLQIELQRYKPDKDVHPTEAPAHKRTA